MSRDHFLEQNYRRKKRESKAEGQQEAHVHGEPREVIDANGYVQTQDLAELKRVKGNCCQDTPVDQMSAFIFLQASSVKENSEERSYAGNASQQGDLNLCNLVNIFDLVIQHSSKTGTNGLKNKEHIE